MVEALLPEGLCLVLDSEKEEDDESLSHQNADPFPRQTDWFRSSAPSLQSKNNKYRGGPRSRTETALEPKGWHTLRTIPV